ncbi:MAG: nucleotidyltransferase domain-containing protein, partial [Sphaerospermopsis kisseleviana]
MNTENIPVKKIPRDLLDDITQRLVSALNPEQVILFGSYAYGEPTEDSDVDLLVIISD